jgi:hypothetical protein
MVISREYWTGFTSNIAVTMRDSFSYLTGLSRFAMPMSFGNWSRKQLVSDLTPLIPLDGSNSAPTPHPRALIRNLG